MFINSGVLGHAAVATLLKDTAARIPCLRARHINLSDGLSVSDRVIRRVLSLQLTPSAGPAANLDLRRWRQELNVGWLAARRIRAAQRQIAPRGFDVLHFHPQATAYVSLDRMKDTPSIVSIDATARLAIESATSRLGRLSHRASVAHDGAVFRAARAIVATSKWASGDLASLYPECASKVRVMPYPIDASRFDSSWIEERATRTAANSERAVRVLFVGGDFPRKGGVELLAAWRASGLAGRAILDLATDWPVLQTDLPDGVHLVRGVSPYTSSWFDLWRRADMFVMPSRQEAFGMVYQEAAAAGIPSVATNVSAIPEIVQDAVTGLLVRPGDHDGLVRAMRMLVESSDLRCRMGAAARRRIAAVANPAAYAATLAELVQELVQTA